MKFKLDYNTWRCGGDFENPKYRLGSDYTKLCTEHEGRMCCLGQFACQLGFEDKVRSKRPCYPAGLGIEIPYLTQKVKDPFPFPFVCVEDTEFSKRCVSINDEAGLTPRSRAIKLQEVCKIFGHELELVNFPSEEVE